MSAETAYTFPAPVLRDPEVAAGYMHHYIPIPVHIADILNEVTHVEGTLDAGRGTSTFRRALHRQHSGELRLKFGEGWLREAGAEVGSIVHVVLAEDPDPNRVDVPPELAAALDLEPSAAEAWGQLAPSRRKTYAYHVGRAKQSSTRVRRTQKVIRELLASREPRDQ